MLTKKSKDLIIICGPPAVGKMTVGLALAEITELKLFHNHMSLELVNQFFDFGTPSFSRLDKIIRFSIFEEIAKSDLAGVIFTIVLAFDLKEDEDYLDEIIQVFEDCELKVGIVDLSADLAVRLQRNRQEDRIKAKPSKGDLEFSEKALLSWEEEYRMNSEEGEFPNKQILRINNTNLSPEQVAQQIKDYFSL